MMVRRVPFAVLALLLGGCAVVDDFRFQPPEVVAHLEVFNRTETDLFYVAADGERLDVPACGSASDPTFRVEDVRVRTEEGYIRGFGTGPDVAGRQLTLVEVSRAADSGIPTPEPPPDPLPACAGIPEVQVGI